MPVAPPKPWESRPSTISSSASSLQANQITPSTSVSSAPSLPPKPVAMSSDTNAATTSAAAPTATSTSLSPYNRGLTSYSSYSPYSRFGTTYGGYGGYGGYGSYGGYGGYGSYGGYGGMNSFSPYGNYPPTNDPNQLSLMQQMEASTQSTFQLLQSIVQTFGGFSQMLESTFMATHSSFFAMIGLAEQFSRFRNYLGEVLSLFAVWRWARESLRYIRGKKNEGLGVDEFKNFEATGQIPKPKNTAPSNVNKMNNGVRPSKKPLVIFFLAIFGIPYLMTKLVRLIARKQEEQRLRIIASGGDPNVIQQNGVPPHLIGPDGQPIPMYLNANSTPSSPSASTALDTAKVLFVRSTYSHHPEGENNSLELSFEKGDIIAVLTPEDERAAMIAGGEAGWWKGRLRDGRVGWFPSNFVEEIKKKDAVAETKKVD